MVYIYRAAREAVKKFPPLANNTELDGCLSILKQLDNIA